MSTITIDELSKIKLPNDEGSWGCLHCFLDPSEDSDRNYIENIRSEVVEIYQKEKLLSFSFHSSEDLQKATGEGFLQDPMFFNGDDLIPDEVLIDREACDGWVAIMPHRLELTLPGSNPLAKKLSYFREVLVTTHIDSYYSEITLYREGQVVGMCLAGPKTPTIPIPAPTFDFTWFEGKGAAVSGEELSQSVDDFETFLSLAGPDSMGLRYAFINAPLSDYPPKSYSIFRDLNFFNI